MKRFTPALLAEENAFTEEFCKSLIDRFDTKMKPAMVLMGKDTEVRDANAWQVTKREDAELVEKFEKVFFDVNAKNWDFDLSNLRDIQVIRYDSGGHYDWHIDIGTGANKARKLSMVVPLNDPSEWEGAELLMKANPDEVSMPFKVGVPIVFPSFILHKATPVTSGVRYIVAAFCYGPTFK